MAAIGEPVIQLQLDKHLLFLPVPNLPDIDVNVSAVGGDDGMWASRDFSDFEPVAIEDLHMELHVHEPDRHETANASGEATAEVVPILDEGVRPVGMVRHEPERRGVVRSTVPKRVDGEAEGVTKHVSELYRDHFLKTLSLCRLRSSEDEIHLRATRTVRSITDEKHTRNRVLGLAL